MRSVTLIGMPGSGKSAVGRILATRLGFAFLDTDKFIERRRGVPLQALVDQLGEQAFRKLEEESILELSVSRPSVISTGGSVVYSEAAMAHLSSLSTVVFLDAPLPALRRHIDSQAPRGIVGLKEGGLEELYRERRPLYLHFAAITVRLTSETPEEAATIVLAELGETGRDR